MSDFYYYFIIFWIIIQLVIPNTRNVFQKMIFLCLPNTKKRFLTYFQSCYQTQENELVFLKMFLENELFFKKYFTLKQTNLGHRQLWVLQFLYFYAAHCTHWSFVLGMVLYDLYPMVTIDVISYIASVACSNPIMQLIFYFLCSTTASVTQFYSQISTQVVVYILWGIMYSGQSCCNSL